ncbi:MAG: hypothetical protein Q9173_003307 [Seirophora scorigena]
MICLLALPNMLQRSEETDHRHDGLGSIVDSHNLHLTTDPAIPGEGDQIEEDQPSRSEPSAEPDNLPIVQDSLPDVEVAEAEARRDRAPDHESTSPQTVSPAPNLPTEEDQSLTEQDPPSPSDANDSDRDNSDSDLATKVTLFLDDCTHKERAQLVDRLGEIHQQGLDQGYAEGCVRGDARSAAFQGRLYTQHAVDLEDVAAQRDSISQQLEQRTAESQELKSRKDELNAQRIEIKRIGELKKRRPGPRTSAKMQRKLGVVNSPPKPPLAFEGMPISSAAKGKGKMPVGNHSGKAEVRSLKTTWRPDQEESRPQADALYSATQAQPAVSKAKEETTELGGASTGAPSIGRSLDNGSGSEAQCRRPTPTRGPAPVDRSKESVSPPSSANTPKTVLKLSAGPSKSVPTPSPSSASPSAPSESSATPMNSGSTAAPGTVHSSPPAAPCRKPIGLVDDSHFDDLAAGLASIKLEDQHDASIDDVAAGLASIKLEDQHDASIDDLTAGLALIKLEDQYAAAIDDLTARLALIKIEDQQAASESEPTAKSLLGQGSTAPVPYDVPLPHSSAQPVAGHYEVARQLEQPFSRITTPPTGESGDTRMSDPPGSSSSDSEDAYTTRSRRHGAQTQGAGLVRWLPLTARRPRRISKKRTVSPSAYAPKSLKLGPKQRSVSQFMTPLARRGEAVRMTRATKRLMIVDRPGHSSRKWAHEQWAKRQDAMDLQ